MRYSALTVYYSWSAFDNEKHRTVYFRVDNRARYNISCSPLFFLTPDKEWLLYMKDIDHDMFVCPVLIERILMVYLYRDWGCHSVTIDSLIESKRQLIRNKSINRHINESWYLKKKKSINRYILIDKVLISQKWYNEKIDIRIFLYEYLNVYHYSRDKHPLW